MHMMSIPDSFKWIDKNLEQLNELSYEDKRKLSKKEEMNIRQKYWGSCSNRSFRKIAKKINLSLGNIC